MKNRKKGSVLYFVSVFVPIIYLVLDIAQTYMKAWYSKNFEYPLILFILNIFTPVIVSVLFFVKISLQKKMLSKCSRILNIVVTILLIAGILLFYNPFNLLYLVMRSPMLAFVFCLQICSLIYDIAAKETLTDDSAD